MKNTETVYVVLDCFDYDETDGVFPVAVTGSLESAKKQAQQRAKEVKQEIIDEFNGDRYSDDDLSIKEVDEKGPFYPKFTLGVYNDEGLMEKVVVFKQPFTK